MNPVSVLLFENIKTASSANNATYQTISEHKNNMPKKQVVKME